MGALSGRAPSATASPLAMMANSCNRALRIFSLMRALLPAGVQKRAPLFTGGAPNGCRKGPLPAGSAKSRLLLEADEHHGASAASLGGIQCGLHSHVERAGDSEVPIRCITLVAVAEEQVVFLVEDTEDQDPIAIPAAG